MNILFNRPSTPEAMAIRERIFNVLPSASYQMEKLFGLFDIEFSEETETGCVECRTTPRLLLNKESQANACSDESALRCRRSPVPTGPPYPHGGVVSGHHWPLSIPITPPSLR
jgi:hypothetical protein